MDFMNEISQKTVTSVNINHFEGWDSMINNKQKPVECHPF